MEHFVMMKEERRYRVVREEKYEYRMAVPPQDNDPLKMMLEHQGKRAEQKAFVREEQYEYYVALPPQDDPLRIMLEHLGKRAEQKAFVGEEQYEYYVAPPPQDDPLRIMLEHLGKRAEQKALVENQKQSCRKGPYLHVRPNVEQQPVAHKGPNIYVRPGIAHQGTYNYVQQPSAGNQVPPSKKHGGVMDCNEVARLCGGVVFTDYSRNKLSLPDN